MKSSFRFLSILWLLAAILVPPSLSASENSPLDINSATFSQLMQLRGITPVWARRILRFRPYTAKNELDTRGIVSHQEYERIQDQIVAHRTRRP